MRTERWNDLRAFRDFADLQLSRNEADLTLDDVRAGDTGTSIHEVLAELRRKYQLLEHE